MTTTTNGHNHKPHDRNPYDSDNDSNNEDDISPPPPDVNSCTTVEELRAALTHLTAQDARIESKLRTLLSKQSELEHSLTRLDLLRAHLGTQVVAARTLSNTMLSPAATTAQRVSSAVKRLDIEQSRVKATLEVVEQVAELKACVLGVTGSMGAPQDWETAASFLHRAGKIPQEIIRGEFAEEIVPTAEVPDLPSVTLENAAESLCGLFLREFERAAEAADGEKVTRFFKLFPLIGRTDVGLEVYGRYVCQGVAARARDALAAKRQAAAEGAGGLGDFFYANAVTRLFEHIANIVEQHGKLVERHYGEGRMVKVIERLQVEADTQGGIIIDTFTDERSIDRKLTDIKSYAFSFLVQSFMPSTRGPMGGPPRSGSPAPGGAAHRNSEDEGVDVKEVDMLLSEIGVMLGRWSLYCRFLARKCLVGAPPEPEGLAETDILPPLTVPPVITNSALYQKVQDRLVVPFNAMTTFFCRRSVEKAFQLDESPSDLSLSPTSPASSSNPPYITSAVDDVMYIVNNLLQRALHTSQRALVSNVISTVGRVLGSDFVGMIQRKMQVESYPKASSGIPGAPVPDDKILGFLVLLNNLDVASDYTHRIISAFVNASSSIPGAGNNPGLDASGSTAIPLEELFPFQTDAAIVRDALKGMETTFEGKAGELTNDGIMVFFNQVVKPKLRPLLAEAFRDVEYFVSPEDDENAYSRSDPDNDDEQEGIDPESKDELVKLRFQTGWDALMTPYKRILTEKVFNKLLNTTASYFSKLLEKRIWGYAGRISELGAIRLERDVAGVVGVVVRGGLYGVRDAFARCSQICLVVNMEEDEVGDLLTEAASGGGGGGGGGVEWVLDVEERRRARGMVVGKR
ncbi:COG4-domain-containing protein [Choiromyces venosus 120613-1]|uniref:Conserved oligomeric Golgi complex subunit 4 n=1 Tax=Choiromyces venosus 120613-1 TaxID=1336337 RepID=A0A3N4JP71_9PEZI|nr:COG4-domain-containing protein [Choiromyces venosus 120613-1]